MDKEKFEIWMMEYLSGTLGENERKEFEIFLQDQPGYRHQYEELNAIWSQMGGLEIPEPSQSMDDTFYDILHEEMKGDQKQKDKSQIGFSTFLSSLWRPPQLAYGLVLLSLGLGIGYLLNSEKYAKQVRPIVVSQQETEEVRGKLVLTLLEQPSANKRLQGINEANKIEKVDDRVILALLQTLDSDSNVNVRLAAIESLTNYLDNPKVREGLVKSIVKQESPIVQVTLANLMVALQEKKSVEPFRTLIRSKELNETVRQKLETSIESII